MKIKVAKLSRPKGCEGCKKACQFNSLIADAYREEEKPERLYGCNTIKHGNGV